MLKTVEEAAPDESLVRACLAGDRRAFDALVLRHQRQVYQLCRRFTGNHEDASELAQDAFVRAYRALGSFRGGSTFRTWMYRIAVNVCLNRAALKRPKSERLVSAEYVASPVEAADEAAIRAERARAVRDAITRLPPKQRATLILRVYHELSHEEIAATLGGTAGGAKGNLFHALRRLRQILTDDR